MKYGAMNFPIRPVVQEIEAIAALGFDYFEMSMDPPEAHFTTARKARAEILKALDDNHLGLVCHLPTFVSIADLTESIRIASLNEMLGSLDVAAELRAAKVVVHPGVISGLGVFVKEQAMEYAMQSMDAIYDKSKELGLQLCLENMFPRYLTFVSPEDFYGVFEKYPGMMMTLDTGHANIGGDAERALKFVHFFRGRLGHVHISDNNGKRDDHLPVGEGNFDFKRFISELKKSGYDDTITLEIFTDNPADLVLSRQRVSDLLASA